LNINILVGSKNPGKIEGAKKAFSKFFNIKEISGVGVESGVRDEPVNEEILLGAENRVKNLKNYAKENNIKVDYYAAIESGITNKLGRWIIINIAYIEDKLGNKSWGTSSGFPVPDSLVDEIVNTDLGTVMDKIFNKKDLRSGAGGISLLTKGQISRIDLTCEAFVMALTQFVNKGKWN